MKAVRVDVEVPGGRTMVRPPRVGFQLLRGRITETTSWFRLELRGTARRIEQALAAFRERGLRVHPSP
jgi:hypothetical protein